MYMEVQRVEIVTFLNDLPVMTGSQKLHEYIIGLLTMPSFIDAHVACSEIFKIYDIVTYKMLCKNIWYM